jgi:hypothetical protein
VCNLPRSFEADELNLEKALCIYDIKLALMNHPGTQAGDGIDEGKVASIVVGPMLGTNILSTSLIAWKAWYVTVMNWTRFVA